ncbi:MAG TPA: FHA domain-containing protein [Planctomycetaceae bacterium]|nr:FHA domain-containing protein [Planctomycetaceae bacterium]
MHRFADRRRRLLLLGRTEPAAGGSSGERIADMGPTDDEPSPETMGVSSNLLVPDAGEKFFVACGGRGAAPRLRIHAGDDGPPEEFVFRRPFALIGRSSRCDLQFEHPDVSYRHAYLQLVDGQLFCFDLASRTGTRWTNGARVAGRVESRGQIAVGPYTILNLDGPVPAGPAGAGAGDSSVLSADSSVLAAGDSQLGGELPPAYIEWTSAGGPPRPRTARLKRSINLLGWSKSCHIRVKREQASHVHASLVLTTAGVWVVDLLGRGGTLLDGKPVVYARLRDGSELQAGTFGFRLRLGEPPPTAPRRPARPKRRRGGGTRDVIVNQNIILTQPGAAGSAPISVATQVSGDPADARPAVEFPVFAAAGGAAAGPSAAGGLSEGFVLSLFGQFAEMQRQMQSQTQQQMLFLTQMLGSLHQNQQDLIREDLRRVSEISDELRALQAQLLQQSLPNGGHVPKRLENRGGVPAGGVEEIVDAAFDFEPAARPSEDDNSDVVPLFGDEGNGVAASSPESSADSEAAARRRPGPPRGVDHHAWLMERMGRLERERNSRWQKIMSLVTGGRRG